MTIATLLVTSIILSFGVSGFKGMVTVMSIGTVVCRCLSGDIGADLKPAIFWELAQEAAAAEFVGLFRSDRFSIFFERCVRFVKDATHPTPLLAPRQNDGCHRSG
jgi:hypothetical protein